MTNIPLIDEKDLLILSQHLKRLSEALGIVLQDAQTAMRKIGEIFRGTTVEMLDEQRMTEFRRLMKKMRRREIYLRKYRRRGLKMSRRQ